MSRNVMLGLAGTLALLNAGVPTASETVELWPRIRMVTNRGDFVVELDRHRAPLTVENFLRYVRDGHYEGTIFHRVIPDFVVQGGGYTPDYAERETRGPIPNESGNGFSNVRGSIAMARTEEPHTATSQFYINLTDNSKLDPRPTRWGYAVFGRVVEGMEVLDAIAGLPTGPAGPFEQDVPQTPVILERVELLEMQEGE